MCLLGVGLATHTLSNGSFFFSFYFPPPSHLANVLPSCWALLDQRFNAWLYQEGVLRTASDAYDASDFENTTAHLTNHCIQARASGSCPMPCCQIDSFHSRWTPLSPATRLFPLSSLRRKRSRPILVLTRKGMKCSSMLSRGARGLNVGRAIAAHRSTSWLAAPCYNLHLTSSHLKAETGGNITLQETILTQIKAIVHDCFQAIREVWLTALSPGLGPDWLCL